MEAIPHLIFNLLAARERVVLPGIGTLYTEQQPAAADASGGLTPPRVRVLFTRAEERSEPIPEFIAAQSGLPLKEVKPHYNRWVSKLKGASTDGELAIEGVVLLIPQPDGSYWAEPSRELDNLLNPIQSQKIQLPVTPAKKEAKKPSETPLKGDEKTPRKPRKSHNRTAWLAVIGALLVVLGYVGHYVWSRGFFTPTPNIPAVIAPVTSVPPQPEITLTLPDTLSQTDSQVSAPADTSAVEKSAAPTKILTGEVYHLVTGVFSTRENAERYVEEKAFDPSRTTIISMANGKFMVSVGKYAQKEDADREMSRLQEMYPQAWVSKRKE